jgi:hypothetical protein
MTNPELITLSGVAPMVEFGGLVNSLTDQTSDSQVLLHEILFACIGWVIPIFLLIKSYLTISGLEIGTEKSSSFVLPSSNKLVYVWMFFVGKLYTIPVIHLATQCASCRYSIKPETKGALVSFYNPDRSCFFTEGNFTSLLIPGLLLVFPLLGYFYRKLEFRRKINKDENACRSADNELNTTAYVFAGILITVSQTITQSQDLVTFLWFAYYLAFFLKTFSNKGNLLTKAEKGKLAIISVWTGFMAFFFIKLNLIVLHDKAFYFAFILTITLLLLTYFKTNHKLMSEVLKPGYRMDGIKRQIFQLELIQLLIRK